MKSLSTRQKRERRCQSIDWQQLYRAGRLDIGIILFYFAMPSAAAVGHF
jgi:hypothetical protein